MRKLLDCHRTHAQAAITSLQLAVTKARRHEEEHDGWISENSHGVTEAQRRFDAGCDAAASGRETANANLERWVVVRVRRLPARCIGRLRRPPRRIALAPSVSSSVTLCLCGFVRNHCRCVARLVEV